MTTVKVPPEAKIQHLWDEETKYNWPPGRMPLTPRQVRAVQLICAGKPVYEVLRGFKKGQGKTTVLKIAGKLIEERIRKEQAGA